MPDNTDFDPTRLVALARARDTRRAYAKSLSDRYQETREQKIDVARRLAIARQNADLHRHGFRAEADAQIADLVAKETELSSRLAEIQAEQDSVLREAGEAGTLFRACLAFAVETGLTIPASLADAAASIDRVQMPMAMPGGAA